MPRSRSRLLRDDCCYLGDDLRDMKAAHAAGMRPIAVEWGYHHPDSGGPDTWQADAIIRHPLELIEAPMKAIVHTVRSEIEQPKPAPAGRDLLVKVEAISVNPVDTKQRKVDAPAPARARLGRRGHRRSRRHRRSRSSSRATRCTTPATSRGPAANSEFHLVDERIVGRKPEDASTSRRPPPSRSPRSPPGKRSSTA